MASPINMSGLIMLDPPYNGSYEGSIGQTRRTLVRTLETTKKQLRDSDDPISRAKYKRAIQDYEAKLGHLKSS